MSENRLKDLSDRWLPDVLDLVSTTIAEASPPGCSLIPMVDYHLGTGGKRLRALLPLAVADVLECDLSGVLPFAAACEVLHNATLVHDDLQDGDELRRGQPTVWRKWGAARAINLGDAMLYWTLALAQKVEADPAARERLVARIVRDTLKVIDGQEREFLLKENPRPSAEDYFRMVEGKTSGLFALPIAGTAELCGAEAELVAALERSAAQLGVLFQIQDDILDLYGDKGRNERGSDLKEGKVSALVVHFLAHAPAEEARWLSDLLVREREAVTTPDIERAAALFEDHGSATWVWDEIDRRHASAVGEPALAAHPGMRALVGEMSELFLAPVAGLRP